MISTITTTVTTVATLTVGAAFGLLASILLIILLSTKEIMIADTRHTLTIFGRNLDIPILPLLITFIITATIKILEVIL
jgi:hypothetical protein